MKLENIIFIVFGAILIDGSFWYGPPLTGIGFLAPVFLGIYFIFIGIFDFSPMEFYRVKKGLYQRETRKSTIIPSENNNNKLSLEEKYYYKGRTNQQLQQYYEAWQCYTKSIRFNPNFEPSIKAKKEVEKIILVPTMEKNTKKDWFKIERIGAVPIPICWQGWACHGIFLLSVLVLLRLLILYDVNSWILVLSLIIAVFIFFILATFKSNSER